MQSSPRLSGAPRPNLFLIGAMKAGTTSLASWLGESRAIFLPCVKEPNHLCTELHRNGIRNALPKTLIFDIDDILASAPSKRFAFSYIEDREKYLQLYTGSGGYPYRLDASTTYLNSPDAAAQIAVDFPDSKIICVTRDPVHRAWSEFVMNVRIGICNNDYEEALRRETQTVLEGRTPLLERYITTGMYDRHISRYNDLFDSSRILVLKFDDLHANFSHVRDSVADFLGISDLPPVLPKENQGQIPRSGALNRWLHQTGVKYFARDVIPYWLHSYIKGLIYRSSKPETPDNFSEIFQKRHSQISFYLDSVEHRNRC